MSRCSRHHEKNLCCRQLAGKATRQQTFTLTGNCRALSSLVSCYTLSVNRVLSSIISSVVRIVYDLLVDNLITWLMCVANFFFFSFFFL